MSNKLKFLALLTLVMALVGFAATVYATSSSELAEKPPETSEEKDPKADNHNDADKLTETKPSSNPMIPGGITCPGENKVCIVDKTGRPLRIVTRTATPLFEKPDKSSKIISDNVVAFQPAYVFSRQDLDFSQPASPKGWYQVGYVYDSSPIGWMRAADVMEWRQALLVAYSHPGDGAKRRPPLLLFETLEDVQNVVLSKNRKQQAKEFYDLIDDHKKPKGVIATEPLEFVDIDTQFYFTPILEWQKESSISNSHYFRLMNAVPGVRAASSGEGTLLDEKKLEQGLKEDGRSIDELRIDVKFVVDMTGSMQPYIDQVKHSISGFVQTVKQDEKLANLVRFGLVGYRDNHKKLPGLEWTAKNFTPEMVNAEQMLVTLENGGQDLAANKSSDEWREDVLAGVRLGLQSPWSDQGDQYNTKRFIILIGDASGHQANTENSSTNLSADQLRTLADQTDVSVLSVHVKDDYAKRDWGLAEKQFKKLGTNPGSNVNGDLEYFAVNSKNIERLGTFFKKCIDQLESLSKKIASGDDEGVRKFVQGDQADTDKDKAVVDGLFRSALVEFLGSDTPPGKDFMSWIHDHDLLEPYIRRIDVRVLVSRQDMDNIFRQVKSVSDALKQGEMMRKDFFYALKMLSAKTALGADVQVDKTFGEQEYLDRWVSALPYTSELLNLTPRDIIELEPADRDALMARLDAKIDAFREIQKNNDLWKSLDEGTDTLQDVVALPINMLP